MRNIKLLVLCASSFLGPIAFAQVGLPEYVPLKINQTVDAGYPPSMVTAGVKDGAACVAISVDESGKLSDYVVTAYTNSAFADEALAALRKWTFEPARIFGAPRNSKADLTFRFEIDGVVVVSMDVILYNELVHFKITPNCDVYSACTLSQLDRVPSPTKIVNPVYPRQLARSSRGGHVQVEFYIDPQGHVRMPSVTKEAIEANAELAAVAVMAVEQWQFAPPTSKGRPVLVLARQDFDFKPASS
jgi:TonB family protein